MKLCDFTVPELNHYRELCNFTDDEMAVFNLKAKGKSIVQISMELNISESQVSKLTSKINKKMVRIS